MKLFIMLQTWWQSKDLRQRVMWLWFSGFTLFVILSIAKTLGGD